MQPLQRQASCARNLHQALLSPLGFVYILSHAASMLRTSRLICSAADHPQLCIASLSLRPQR